MPETTPVTMQMPVLPEGWEYTGEFRCPLDREHLLDSKGTPAVAVCDYAFSKHPIVRKVWQAPERVRGTGLWLSVDERGWLLSEAEPMWMRSLFGAWGEGLCPASAIFKALIGDNLPLHLLDLPPERRKVRL